MKRIILFLCAVAWLTACNDDKGEPWERSKVSRSVLVYMAGENNLTSSKSERYLRNDLNEIIKGSELLTDDQRLFVFVDSMITNSADKQTGGKPYIMEVHGGKTYVRHEFDSDFYSSDPAYFRQILQWMCSNAEADDYGLVLWGHACGWTVLNDTVAQSRMVPMRAYGEDDGEDMTGGSLKWMNITQMAKAMQGLPKLKYIFADCCNMMCAEVGYELRNATEYLIGSPAEIPGNGAPYDRIIPDLFRKNDSELYRGIIDTYYNYYLNEEFKGDTDLGGYSVPLSVIDTKYMDALARQTHDILATFTPNYPENIDCNSLVYYWHYDTSVMYDMKAVIKKNASETDFRNWENSFKQAVPYYRMSMKWMTIYSGLDGAFRRFNPDASINGCVSMYIPFNTYYYNYGDFKYNKTCNNLEWNRAMEWNRFGW